MKARIVVIALVIGVLAVLYSFTAANQPVNTPQHAAVLDSGKMFGEGVAQFKKKAGHPLSMGMCDKKDGHFMTNVVLYEINGIQLFEIKNSGKKFFYMRTENRALTFFQEREGKFEEIPLHGIDAVLDAAGAPEFAKSINASGVKNDCVEQRVGQGIGT
jgi:hypothetical protein